MIIILFLFCMIVSIFFVINILHIVSIDELFWGVVWILIPYGLFWSWLIYELDMGEFVFWQACISALYLLILCRQQSKIAEKMLDSKGKDANEVRYVAMLYLRSIRKYTYGSIVYICSFIGGSFWLYYT
ncbi:hypothetical protein [Photobacterium kishitanii]|nr:hypothetical protein [Photobacterium kishitanii]PSW61035.1 hypothetical protein C0W54_12190 [Photobacterium kishitanii]